MNPKISIITACLNSEKTIKRTIESVLSQNYKHLEYIIIDGGSSDNTISIIKSYSKKFEKLGLEYKYISEPDNGIYDAFNKGVSIATGELIGIIGSDDWYEKEVMNLIVNFYNKEACDYIHGNMNIYSNNNHFLKTIKPSSKILMMKKMTFFHPTSFIKKSVYQELNGYSLEYDICSDYDLILRILKRNYSIKYINKTIANFSNGGVSTTQIDKALLEAHLVRVDNGYNKVMSYYFYYRALLINKMKQLFSEISS